MFGVSSHTIFSIVFNIDLFSLLKGSIFRTNIFVDIVLNIPHGIKDISNIHIRTHIAFRMQKCPNDGRQWRANSCFQLQFFAGRRRGIAESVYWSAITTAYVQVHAETLYVLHRLRYFGNSNVGHVVVNVDAKANSCRPSKLTGP